MSRGSDKQITHSLPMASSSAWAAASTESAGIPSTCPLDADSNPKISSSSYDMPSFQMTCFSSLTRKPPSPDFSSTPASAGLALTACVNVLFGLGSTDANGTYAGPGGRFAWAAPFVRFEQKALWAEARPGVAAGGREAA